MSLPDKLLLVVALSIGLGACATESAIPRFGQPVSEAQLAGFDLIIEPSGAGLPPGGGNAVQGRTVFNDRCQSCHGASGEGANPSLRLVGGDMQSESTPVKTVGSYWPHATTVFDYIRRAMPADAPKSLSDTEVYQVTAYLLFLNGIIGERDVMDRESLPAVRMPNSDGFVDHSDIQ